MRTGVGRVRTVMVLGGTSEIGLVTATALLGESGGTAILAGRDPAALADAAGRLANGRRTVLALPYRASDSAEAVAELLSTAAGQGDLDVVLICVGALGEQAQLDADTKATRESLVTNMLGPAIAAHAAARVMARQGHGVVVVLSSVSALRPRREILTYSAAKAGLDAYACGLADVFARTGARVMVVRPGQVRTRMTAGLPESPLAVEASQVARAIQRGLRSGARVVYVPPVMRLVMAGLRALPGPMFRRVAGAEPPARPPAPGAMHGADRAGGDTA